MREFVVPKIDTKHIGEVKLEYAFRIHMQLDKPSITRTPHGGRIFHAILGGTVKGPKFNGAVHADGGGDYGLLRADNVEDINTHFMIRDEVGEWVYISQSGYHRRADGYYRVTAYFDAEKSGKHAWLNESVLIATARFDADRTQAVFEYYEAT
jgi:hypothetical protein